MFRLGRCRGRGQTRDVAVSQILLRGFGDGEPEELRAGGGVGDGVGGSVPCNTLEIGPVRKVRRGLQVINQIGHGRSSNPRAPAVSPRFNRQPVIHTQRK